MSDVKLNDAFSVPLPHSDYEPVGDHVAELRRADANGFDSTEAVVRPRRIGRMLFRLAIIPLAIVAALGATRAWHYMDSYESTDDAQIDGHIAPISSRISGTVARVYVEDTQLVASGAAVADLDARDEQAAADNARANLAQAIAMLDSARADAASAQAKVRQADATNAQAQKDADRYISLFGQHVVSRADYDDKVRAAAVDQAALESERANANAVAKTIGSREAAVKAAQAALEQAQLNLEYTKIAAPMSGIVGKKSVEVGERVQPGQQMLAIVPLDDIWITANFKETQIRRIVPGQRATIYVDATGREYEGNVVGLAGASGERYSLLPPENATGNYVKVVQRLPIKIRLKPGQNQDHRLRPGMSVESTVWLR